MSLSRRIASATIQLTLSGILVRLLSLITMPLLTRLLSPSAYGTAAMAGTFVSLIAVFALSGMDMSYMRTYHSNVSPSGHDVEIFVWRYVLGTGLLAGVCLACTWGLLARVFSLPVYLGGLLGLCTFLSLACAMSTTRARLGNRYRAMSVASAVSGVGAAIISLGVAWCWRQDELPLILSLIAGYLLPVLLLGGPSCGQLLRPSGLSGEERLGVWKIGLAGTVTAPAYWLLSSADRWFLGYYEDVASVGIYSIGYSVAIMGMMANSAVLTVWTPETAREYDNNREQAPALLGKTAERLVAGFACVWLAIVAAGGEMIRLLAAPSFHDAGQLVPYIAGGVFFHGVIHLANASYLLMKRLDLAMRWWLVGGIACIALNWAFVPWLGRLGAALAQIGAFSLIAVGMVRGAQGLYPLYLHWTRLFSVLAGVVLAGAFMAQPWSSSPLWSLLLKAPVGLFVVLLVAKVVAPEALTFLISSWIAARPRGEV
ncbi:MAG: hypothetical protein BWK76_19810 [Desulfobulbaceae bacterium A2]|nr:MAG: hypothetical protein BWK76_19810 [Desulfobulbaceae bacterium A2]